LVGNKSVSNRARGRMWRLWGLVALLLSATIQITGVRAEPLRLNVSILDEPQEITHQWLFKAEDSAHFSDPDYLDSDWQAISLQQPWPLGGYADSNQVAWYRLTLDLGRQAKGNPYFLGNLGIKVGRVYSAYEIFAGGIKIGHRGAMPPESKVDWDRPQALRVPPEAVGDDGILTLAVRVWGGPESVLSRWGGGFYREGIVLGDYFKLSSGLVSSSIPAFFLAGFFVICALFSFFIYSRSTMLQAYFWFGLVSINLAVYCFTLSDLRFVVPLDFVVYEKLEYASVCFIAPLLVHTVWGLFEEELSPFMRASAISCAAFGALIVIVPGLSVNFIIMDIFRVFALLLLARLLLLVVAAWRCGDPRAPVFVLGSLVFMVTSIHDLVINRIVDATPGPSWSMYGLLSLIVCMAVLLGRDYAAVLDNLGELVGERTAELSEANKRLAQHARQDSLTALQNRRGFIEQAQQAFDKVGREHGVISLILCDVDHFKRINDRYGHAVGDRVLQHLAHHLASNVREVDVIGRWGGEEFILLLPDLSLAGAQTLAQRLCDSLPSQIFRVDDIRLGLTMTFGVAQLREYDTLEQLTSRADAALYEGKARGRCQVVSEKLLAAQGLGH